MPRYKLVLEYDGAPFRGWQRQSNGPSVQASLEAAGARLRGAKVQVLAPRPPRFPAAPPTSMRFETLS